MSLPLQSLEEHTRAWLLLGAVDQLREEIGTDLAGIEADFLAGSRAPRRRVSWR
jgi:hypothetical protein